MNEANGYQFAAAFTIILAAVLLVGLGYAIGS